MPSADGPDPAGLSAAAGGKGGDVGGGGGRGGAGLPAMADALLDFVR